MTEKRESRRLIKERALYAGAAAAIAVSAFGVAYSGLPALFSVSYVVEPVGVAGVATVGGVARSEEPKATHLPTPSPLRGIYMSQCVVGTPTFRDSLVAFVGESELNTVVIDIRDYTGMISFKTDNPALQDSVSKACGASDMREFIGKLHEKGIYVIGRITTFQNPYWSTLHPEHAVQKKSGGVWHDRKGLAFIDVGAKPYWDNVVELGKEAYAAGFDELNFDYIRYPSDGPMAEADYTWSKGASKAEMLEEFYAYITNALRPTGAVLSADLFGYVTVHEDDLGIGQILERALPYFDYIYPMVYPSHYNSGFAGLTDVNSDPYKVVYTSLIAAVARELATSTTIASRAYTPIASTTPQRYEKPVYSGKVVPWLQSFDYPVVYTPEMVMGQIRAARDAGIESYIFWDAANKYSALRKVLSTMPPAQ